MTADFLTALALVLVIEGVVYALFPGAMQRMMVRLTETPTSMLRATGLASAALGVFLVWLLRG
ncbi:MAG: DUF2065 domain-containing protein [Alphaproteobacteria bacterium]